VVERLRNLAGRPLDRQLGRAVLAIGLAVTIGFAALVALSGGAGPRSGQEPGPTAPAPRPAASRPPVRDHPRRRSRPRQDPQDRPGSVAARRAERELASHRALQHVPWHGEGVSIRLVGARGDKAVLAVRAAGLATARRGYRAFLRRHHDDGHSYLPHFTTGRAG
jgi:hypothetical protein